MRDRRQPLIGSWIEKGYPPLNCAPSKHSLLVCCNSRAREGRRRAYIGFCSLLSRSRNIDKLAIHSHAKLSVHEDRFDCRSEFVHCPSCGNAGGFILLSIPKANCPHKLIHPVMLKVRACAPDRCAVQQHGRSALRLRG